MLSQENDDLITTTTSNNKQQKRIAEEAEIDKRPAPNKREASANLTATTRRKIKAESTTRDQLQEQQVKPSKVNKKLNTTENIKLKQQQQTSKAQETTASSKMILNNQREQEQRTAAKLGANLHSAANEGKAELVRLLLRCGADPNAQDQEFGNTALHQAAWNGFSETVQVLCKYRANTSIRNKVSSIDLRIDPSRRIREGRRFHRLMLFLPGI